MHLLVDRPVGGELPADRRQQLRRDDRMRHQRWDQEGHEFLGSRHGEPSLGELASLAGDYSAAAAMTPA
ncbi:hypothetical protein [Micromonospora sp. NPDC005171]|uniref:hypothetical protein n=1 Tax=Micromonospora sp. NPDC005171 TaxID=3156866 RepID=UPI0033A1EB3C